MRYFVLGAFVLYIFFSLFSLVQSRLEIDNSPSSYLTRGERFQQVQREILRSYNEGGPEWFHAALILSTEGSSEISQDLKTLPKSLNKRHLQVFSPFIGKISEDLENQLRARFEEQGLKVRQAEEKVKSWAPNLSESQGIEVIQVIETNKLSELIRQMDQLSSLQKSHLVFRVLRDCSASDLSLVEEIILLEERDLMIQTYMLALKNRGDSAAHQLLERLSGSSRLSNRLQALAQYLSQNESARGGPKSKCGVS